MRITFAFGYASMSSFAKAQAGQSQTACTSRRFHQQLYFPAAWEQSLLYLAVSKKLVPFLPAELANPVILGSQRIMPHQAVGRVLNARAHHMVGVNVSKPLEGLT